MFIPTLLLAFGIAIGPVLGGEYQVADSFIGSSFLTGFAHQTIADPTNGRVNYTDQAFALAKNLTFTSDDTLILRADDTTVLNSSDVGRNSVRLKSHKQYTTHVSVWNIRHMPQGCATWPAVWEVGSSYLKQGEVDILEGANDASPNHVTVHTGSNCTMPSNRTQLGTATSNDCSSESADNSTSGCTVQAPYTVSYGPAFNNAGGGYYAMERTTELIRVWFWTRDATNIPSEITSGSSTINPSNWGTPLAYYVNSDDCDFSTHFGAHNIIINLTLCGNWAGDDFNAAGCTGDCVTYVNENPSNFSDAYWDVASLRVYTGAS